MSNLLKKVFISRKERDNFPLPIGFNTVNINNKKLFLSKNNIIDMSRTVYSNRLRYAKYNISYDYIISVLPKIMKKWADDNNIQNYNISGPQNYKDFIDLLNFTNTRFLKEHYDLFNGLNPLNNKTPDINLIDPFVITGNINEFDDTLSAIDIKDVYAQDYNSIDIWKNTSTYISNDKYARNNEIRKDQVRMHSRNYDEDPDGLRTTKDRSSLINTRTGNFNIDKYIETHTNDQQRYKNLRY